jgi:hypothetical protein
LCHERKFAWFRITFLGDKIWNHPPYAEIASDDVLDAAYEWLCRRRRDYSADADVWSLRRRWEHEKDVIKRDLLAGDYRFSLPIADIAYAFAND